jgi:tetratricopeptide (TPR) repeat protein/peptidoglycan/xylan/chitin deacetylase (PgdA/CDA1 family)
MSEDKPNFSQAGGYGRDNKDRPNFHKTPPVVPERVAILKANYKQAWLYFLLGLSLLVAWGIPLRYAMMRWIAFRPADEGERDAHAFVVLAYEGISDNENEVSSIRFREQMDMLKREGYHAVNLEDIHSFYETGEPLPRKAVLLTFDHSRKSSYFDARKVLRKIGWQAVMFIWTKPILDEDPAALRWPYVRDMVRSGAWEAGAQSHMGFMQIPADSTGGTRNFMASPRWLSNQSRYEDPSAFKARLEADHQFVYDLITKETGQAPRAFAFPYGDFGQYDERAILSRRLNMDLVSQFYDLGFVYGGSPLNTSYSDPRRLNRMLVKPEWTAEDLKARLDNSWPRDEGLRSELALRDPLVWFKEWGGLRMEEDTVRLFATPETTGAKAWLNGTDLYGDFRGHLRFDLTKGQAGLYLRASSDGESYLYLGLGDKGELWLRQKHAGMEPFTLGSSRYPLTEDGQVDVEVFLRGNLFSANVAGEPVFDEIITTRGEPQPGMVGISIWEPTPEAATLTLHELDLVPFTSRVVYWEPVSTREPTLAGWLSANAFRYTHLAPPWMQMDSRGRAEQMGWNVQYFRELSELYDMKLTPAMTVYRLDVVEQALANKLAQSIHLPGVDGLFCDMRQLQGNPPVNRITQWIQMLSEALAERKMELIVVMPEALEDANSLQTLFLSLPNLQVAVAEESALYQSGEIYRNPRLVSCNSVTIDSGYYPLNHQLTGLDAERSERNQDVRSHMLRSEGLEAFKNGQFKEAINTWTRWSQLEPYNEEPYRLIGDVYVRTGNYEKGIEAYQQSLELNPGQVPLVVNTARLMEEIQDRDKEAMDMLLLYRNLFPANSEILLAQAGMFMRQERYPEASETIANVIELNPEDLSALGLLHKLLRTPEERVENLDKIREVGTRPGMELHLANAVEAYDLLIWPESWRLMDVMAEKTVEETEAQEVQKATAFERLLPRETQVRERFVSGKLSGNWVDHSDSGSENPGMIYLASRANTTEAAVNLEGSETLQNGFIECVVDEVRGYMWLYARRSEGNMVRFGFDPSGNLYLQVWQNGDMISNMNRKWERPVDEVRLRLEIRGDAAFAFVEGEPAFGSPSEVPKNLNLGWWGIAPWATEFGVAEAVVREVAGGPTAVHIGMFKPRVAEWNDEQLTRTLRPYTHELSAIAPLWFFQDTTGEIRFEVSEKFTQTRLLARYYKIRLLPMIRSVSERMLDVESLIERAKLEKVDGFTLVFARLPHENWFAKAEELLLGSEVSLLAVRMDDANNVVECQEVGPADPLFAGPRIMRPLPVVHQLKPEAISEENPEALEDPEQDLKPTLPSIERYPPPSNVLQFLLPAEKAQ